MTWSEKRKLSLLGIVFSVIAAAVYIVIHQAVTVAPTCYDNKRNGNEVGVDCGGSCTFYCKNELAEPKVRWVRTFEITPGIVHAVAYIQHSYPVAGARALRYQFKIYDEKNTLITERTGSTFLGPMGETAIVETLIPVGNVTPAVTRFSFLPPVPWEKIAPDFSNVVIKTDKYVLEPFTGGTRLTVTLDNKSRYSFTDLDVVAILYDASGNAITASKVLVPSVTGLSQQTAYFTWPFTIRVPVSRVEVIPRFNPFTARAL